MPCAKKPRVIASGPTPVPAIEPEEEAQRELLDLQKSGLSIKWPSQAAPSLGRLGGRKNAKFDEPLTLTRKSKLIARSALQAEDAATLDDLMELQRGGFRITLPM